MRDETSIDCELRFRLLSSVDVEDVSFSVEVEEGYAVSTVESAVQNLVR